MTKIEHIRQEQKSSYDIKVTTEKRGSFIIPVVSVRDGDDARQKVNKMIKAGNRSKFTQPSFSEGGNSYQVSTKRS